MFSVLSTSVMLLCALAIVGCDESSEPMAVETATTTSTTMTPKVLIIGIDGLRPDALMAAQTPAIDALIEPFTRGEASRNSETGGAGLGLALALAIAEQHGGTLALLNRQGADGKVAGLTAELRLPLSKA